MPAELSDRLNATDAALAARVACDDAAALGPLYERHRGGADPARIEVGPERVVIRRGPGARDGSGADPEEVQVEVVRRSHDQIVRQALPPLPPMAPITLLLLPRGKGETKSLGTREFDGIKAEGTMTTHTIPVDAKPRGEVRK